MCIQVIEDGCLRPRSWSLQTRRSSAACGKVVREHRSASVVLRTPECKQLRPPSLLYNHLLFSSLDWFTVFDIELPNDYSGLSIGTRGMNTREW